MGNIINFFSFVWRNTTATQKKIINYFWHENSI